MLSYFQAIVFGIVQGITELFPVSSLGHSVILPSLLGWKINQHDTFFLTFLVATHTATALVLLFFFLNDWKEIVHGLLRSLKQREVKETDTYAKLGWLLIVSTIPAGILGLLFEESLKIIFAEPKIVSLVLIGNGIMLFTAELLRNKTSREVNTNNNNDKRIAKKLTYKDAAVVGLLQCLALIPGFSRTGATITGSLLMGLSHEDAARYGFLLATPIIIAASILKLPDLVSQNGLHLIGPIFTGAITAGIFAFLSVKFLTRYFESKTLIPFAIYCSLIGAFSSLLFLLI